MAVAPEFLTVRELADLLRIKERKVYDLAATGEVPCTRATGKLLFPEAEIRAWMSGKQSGTVGQRPAVFLGSHDPLLEWALRQSRCGLAMYFDGSSDGLERFASGEGIAAGMHIHGEADGDWNIGSVAEACGDLDAVLIAWATRKRGLVLRSDHAAGVRSVADIAGRTLAARQPQSGASRLLDTLIQSAGVADITMTSPYHSEQDAVLAVAEGDAEVTFGLEVVARQFGLEFVPIVDERFDILVDRAAYFDPPMQTLLAFCRSEAFLDRAKSLSGYNLAGLGEVRWNR